MKIQINQSNVNSGTNIFVFSGAEDQTQGLKRSTTELNKSPTPGTNILKTSYINPICMDLQH